MSLIACGVAVCPRQRTGSQLYVVVKSDNAISCIKMRAKVIAAASGGRERSPIAMGSGFLTPISGMACFLFPLPPKAETRGGAPTCGDISVGSLSTEIRCPRYVRSSPHRRHETRRRQPSKRAMNRHQRLGDLTNTKASGDDLAAASSAAVRPLPCGGISLGILHIRRLSVPSDPVIRRGLQTNKNRQAVKPSVNPMSWTLHSPTNRANLRICTSQSWTKTPKCHV